MTIAEINQAMQKLLMNAVNRIQGLDRYSKYPVFHNSVKQQEPYAIFKLLLNDTSPNGRFSVIVTYQGFDFKIEYLYDKKSLIWLSIPDSELTPAPETDILKALDSFRI